MAEATPESEQLVHAYVDVWNEQDYTKIPDLVSESFVMHDPPAPEEGVPGPAREVHGPDGLKAYIHGVIAGFPDWHVTVLDMLSGDDLVMYEGEITMTHEGEFNGIPRLERKSRFDKCPYAASQTAKSKNIGFTSTNRTSSSNSGLQMNEPPLQ